MWLRERILMSGYQVPMDEIDRGQLLVHTSEEWRSRYESYMRSHVTINSVVYLGLGIILTTLMYLAIGTLGAILLVCLVVLMILMVHSAISTGNDLEAGGPSPGIYENGIEMPIFPMYATRLFIPWSEANDAWVKRSSIFRDMLYVSVTDSRWRWRFPATVLGEEGVATAIHRARTPPTLQIPEPEDAPPRLVLYTSEGVRTESIPEDL